MTTTISFSLLDWQPLGNHARQKQEIVAGQRLRLLQLDAGFHEEIWCHNAHYGYVIDGELQIQFQGGKEDVGPGDGIALPGGEAGAHKAVVLKGPVTLFLVEPVPSQIAKS